MNESLSEWQYNILKIISKRFKTGDTPTRRSWLLPNGQFLTMDDYNTEAKTVYPHYTVDNFIGNFIWDYLHKSWEDYRWDSEEEKAEKRQKYDITEEDIKEIYDKVDWEEVGNEYGSPLLESMGCVRLNAETEHIILLPSKYVLTNFSNHSSSA